MPLRLDRWNVAVCCYVPGLLVSYDALNRYVSAAIACFALVLYVAVLWVGWADIKGNIKKRTEISKRASSGRYARRYRKTKRSS